MSTPIEQNTNGLQEILSAIYNLPEAKGNINAVNYDLNVKAVNHRGYSAEAPENTIPAYIMSKLKGFTYVECDVAFTSDNVAVLLHDATIDRTSNGSGNLSSFTYNQLLEYDFGSWFSGDYAGVKIPTFKEFIMLCKKIGLHPYIELKSSDSYTQAQISQIVAEVKNCGMEGKVTYISFSNTFLGYVKNADSSARLGYLASTLNSTAFSNATALKTDTNEVFMDAKLANLTATAVNNCISKGFPLEIWTVNTEEEIKNMPDYVSGVTSDNLIAGKVLYEDGLIYVPPEEPTYIDATGITLDKQSLTFNDLTEQILTATVEPSNATDEIVWTSSDDSVARVEDGVVTPVSKGNCTITATAGKVSATCDVTISIEVTTYTIHRELISCTSSSEVVTVAEGSSHTETITANNGYEMSDFHVIITMGGVDISSVYNEGVINIESVTGDIIIRAEALEIEPVVDLDFGIPALDDTITNIGTGGETYNAKITKVNASDSYSMDENGLSLFGHAYANVPYGFKASDKFTIVIRGAFAELNDNTYQRLFRTDVDAPSVFYSYTSGSGLGAKLAGTASNNFKAHDSRVYVKNLSTNAALNTAYILPDNIDEENMHSYAFVNDGSKIYYYLDGVLMASQDASPLKTSTLIGVGDNDSSKTYYADKITISEFKIYDYAATADRVAEL